MQHHRRRERVQDGAQARVCNHQADKRKAVTDHGLQQCA
jgi:hypothetical protein